MTRCFYILAIICLASLWLAKGQPIAWFEQNHRGLTLFKIDITQTLDDGEVLSSHSTPYFVDIGELPFPTNIMPGNNHIVAVGWYTDKAKSSFCPMIMTTNVTGKAIEMVSTNGMAQFLSTTNLVNWTTNQQPSPFIVSLNKRMEFFKPLPGTLAALFGDSFLPVQSLTVQDSNTETQTTLALPPIP